MSEDQGASNSALAFLHSRLGIVLIRLDERVLAAARDDNEDLLLEIFEQGNFDINCQDGCVTFLRPNWHPKLTLLLSKTV
jgi:hypothetical protein